MESRSAARPYQLTGLASLNRKGEKCDNRKCVNPLHLFVGTRKDNMADAVAKNRQASGRSLPQTKLNDDDIAEIVKRAGNGEKYSSIAADFSICRQYAGQISIRNGVRRNGLSK